jgi:DNA-directed RNA polymerase specialized sigma24 family protein
MGGNLDSQHEYQLFANLAFENMDSLYQEALRHTLSIEKAETLVQKTFEKAYALFNPAMDRSNSKSWFLDIMRREAQGTGDLSQLA